MNSNLGRAMRTVTELTRAGRLGDATAAIQRALRGEPPSDAASPPADRPSAEPALTDSGRPLGEETNGDVDRKPDLHRPTPAAGSLGNRVRRSLGEVIKALREARLLRPSPAPVPEQQQERAVPEGARFLTSQFTCPAGTRKYKLYLPLTRSAGAPALIVMLHGCTQNPDDFAAGTRMNELAEESGFLVAYPEQPRTANPSSCWNWFQPRDQVRGAGEPSIIAGLTKAIVTEHGADPGRVFVAGLSAGGAMAANLGATYPDVFRAVGIHSGLAHGSATDVVSALAAMRGNHPPASDPAIPLRGGPIRTIIFHGTADQTVHPSNAHRIAAGLGTGEARDQEKGVAGGRSYTRTIIASGAHRSEIWLIEGGGHAWSGGSARGSFADPAGPDASREMVRFFLSESGSSAHRSS